jgi:hypothetical protein
MDSEQVLQQGEKFCKHCGGKIPADAVVCTLCGRQVEDMSSGTAPNIVINNSNQNVNTNVNANGRVGRAKNKWVDSRSYRDTDKAQPVLCIKMPYRGGKPHRKTSPPV